MPENIEFHLELWLFTYSFHKSDYKLARMINYYLKVKRH